MKKQMNLQPLKKTSSLEEEALLKLDYNSIQYLP